MPGGARSKPLLAEFPLGHGTLADAHRAGTRRALCPPSPAAPALPTPPGTPHLPPQRLSQKRLSLQATNP